MNAQSNLHNAAIIDAYDFSGIETLVDVGGSRGATVCAVLARYGNTCTNLSKLSRLFE